MARNRSWSSLSERQKKRYIGAAKTGSLTGTPFNGTLKQREAYAKRYYEGGGDLGGGRGRHNPTGAAPRKAYLYSVFGAGDNPDAKTLEGYLRSPDQLKEWRQSGRAPKWIPTNNVVMSDDTAAALSQIGIDPKNWKSVDIRPAPDRRSYLVTVKSKRGATRVVNVAERDNVSQIAALLRNREKQGRTPKEMTDLYSEWENRNGKPWTIDVTIVDTDPSSQPVVNYQPPKVTKTKAIPNKTKKRAKK